MTRAELHRRHPDLDRVSPRVGMLDEAAARQELATDPDAGLDLLADLARATDPELREQARRLALRLLLPPRRTGPTARRGPTRMTTTSGEGLDLDLDASLERSPALRGRVARADDLRWRAWTAPTRASVLLVDVSGSVAGAPLTTALTTAAALVARIGHDELGVVAFWSRAVVLRPVRSVAPAAAALDALLTLRAGSTTDLALGLRTALEQATAARAARTDVLVLTDGASNEGDDPLPVAASAATAGARVHVLRVVDSAAATAACRRLATAGGGRAAPVLRPSDAPDAVRAVLR